MQSKRESKHLNRINLKCGKKNDKRSRYEIPRCNLESNCNSLIIIVILYPSICVVNSIKNGFPAFRLNYICVVSMFRSFSICLSEMQLIYLFMNAWTMSPAIPEFSISLCLKRRANKHAKFMARAKPETRDKIYRCHPHTRKHTILFHILTVTSSCKTI